MEESPLRPLDRLPQQRLKGPSGERLVLGNGNTQYPIPTRPPGRFINIAKINAAELLLDNDPEFMDKYSFNTKSGFLGLDQSWKWSAVVLMPEEYKLRVGGMSVTELRQQLEYLLRGYKQYTYIKLHKNNRYLQYLLEYVPHSSGYNN